MWRSGEAPRSSWGFAFVRDRKLDCIGMFMIRNATKFSVIGILAAASFASCMAWAAQSELESMRKRRDS